MSAFRLWFSKTNWPIQLNSSQKNYLSDEISRRLKIEKKITRRQIKSCEAAWHQLTFLWPEPVCFRSAETICKRNHCLVLPGFFGKRTPTSVRKLLTYITDSNKFLRCLLFTDGRLQLQYSDTSTKSVKRRMLQHQRSSRVDFWWRNPSSPDVVMKALFRILEPQNRVERNTYFVFAHDFVLALRYLHFFPLLTYMTDSTKYIWRLLFTDGRSQLQRNDIFTKSVKRRILKHRKSSGFLMK